MKVFNLCTIQVEEAVDVLFFILFLFQANYIRDFI